VTDARSEADQILARARSEADTFEERRLQRKADAEQEISQIDVLVDRVKTELAGLSTAVGADLDEMTRTIDTAFAELDEPTVDIYDEAGDEATVDIDDEAGDEATVDIDDEAGDEAMVDIYDEAGDEASLEGLDDENLIASDEPEVSAGFAGAGGDGSSGDVEANDRVEGSEDGEDAEVETDGGAGEGTEEAVGDSGNDSDADSEDADSEDDNYLIFPDGEDDDDGGDEEERSD
jgi:hypothetical protein